MAEKNIVLTEEEQKQAVAFETDPEKQRQIHQEFARTSREKMADEQLRPPSAAHGHLDGFIWD